MFAQFLHDVTAAAAAARCRYCRGLARAWRRSDPGGRWFDSGWSFGQPVKLVELSRFYALQCQMAVGKPLYAAGRIELCPFGAKDGDRIALSAQLACAI